MNNITNENNLKFLEHQYEISEVKPKLGNIGFYYVTLFQFDKEKESHPDYIKDYMYFDGNDWEYIGAYKDHCLVCFIHRMEPED